MILRICLDRTCPQTPNKGLCTKHGIIFQFWSSLYDNPLFIHTGCFEYRLCRVGKHTYAPLWTTGTFFIRRNGKRLLLCPCVPCVAIWCGVPEMVQQDYITHHKGHLHHVLVVYLVRGRVLMWQLVVGLFFGLIFQLCPLSSNMEHTRRWRRYGCLHVLRSWKNVLYI